MFRSVYSSKMTKQKYAVAYILCFALVLVNILSLFNGLFVNSSNNAHVDATVGEWIDYTTSVEGEKDGTAVTYKIATAQEFAYIFLYLTVNLKPTQLTINIQICRSIDLSEHYWVGQSINFNNKSIRIFGNNNSITGLTFKSAKYSGLIGYSKGNNIQFKDLHIYVNLESGYYGESSIGGFIGYLDSGKISFFNCVVRGKVNETMSGATIIKKIGGFVGYGNDINFDKNCFNFANIFSKSSTSRIGGFVGEAKSVSFKYCGNYGDIIINQNTLGVGYAGGLVGYTNTLNLKDARCFNNGNIFSGYAGGLVGYIESSSPSLDISNVYNIGEITGGKQRCGGLVGYSNANVTFKNLYQAGKVSSFINTLFNGFINEKNGIQAQAYVLPSPIYIHVNIYQNLDNRLIGNTDKLNTDQNVLVLNEYKDYDVNLEITYYTERFMVSEKIEIMSYERDLYRSGYVAYNEIWANEYSYPDYCHQPYKFAVYEPDECNPNPKISNASVLLSSLSKSVEKQFYNGYYMTNVVKEASLIGLNLVWDSSNEFLEGPGTLHIMPLLWCKSEMYYNRANLASTELVIMPSMVKPSGTTVCVPKREYNPTTGKWEYVTNQYDEVEIPIDGFVYHESSNANNGNGKHYYEYQLTWSNESINKTIDVTSFKNYKYFSGNYYSINGIKSNIQLDKNIFLVDPDNKINDGYPFFKEMYWEFG